MVEQGYRSRGFDFHILVLAISFLKYTVSTGALSLSPVQFFGPHGLQPARAPLSMGFPR